jgi:hypothetical protein
VLVGLVDRVGISVRHNLHPGTISVLLRSPANGTARDMLRRGVRVQAAARRNLGGASGRPTRIDTGLLRSSIFVKPIVVGNAPGAWIGTEVRYAMWVHDGTGIYGPRGQPIRPVHGRFLVFTPKGAPFPVFARSVKGMRPNPFLKDALPAARG